MTSIAGSALRVDIVINNHNYGRFIEEAIESALNQGHPNTGVIVVDDGSTDDSRERIGRYEGAVDVVLKVNGGQASALNAGLARCTGEIVIFLDSDDMLLPHTAARTAGALASCPDACRVHYRMAVVTAAGEETGAIKPPSKVPLLSGHLQREELAFPFDLPWLPTSGNAFRVDVLRRILPIPEAEYRILADLYLVHLTTLLGPVVSLDEVGALYRVHGQNAYEPTRSRLDLNHVHASITHARPTARALTHLADEIGIARPGRILSFSDLANRLISRKLDRHSNRASEDRMGRLLVDAIRAAARRFDLTLPMKVVFVGWFAATVVAPRPVARLLSELFLFAERRRRLAGVLRGFCRVKARIP